MASVPGKAVGNCRRLQESCVFLFTEADTAPFNMGILFVALATGKGLLSCGFFVGFGNHRQCRWRYPVKKL